MRDKEEQCGKGAAKETGEVGSQLESLAAWESDEVQKMDDNGSKIQNIT